MEISEEIKLFLPKYLSPSSTIKLFSELKSFPDNIDSRMYSSAIQDDVIYQGDGLNDLLIINLPDTKSVNGNCIVLSNTCDIDVTNKRPFVSNIVYSPIIELNKYRLFLSTNKIIEMDQIEGHINSIKKQRITQMFYLPQYNGVNEGIVFLDRLISSDNKLYDRSNLNKKRLFTLSNYGFYLFLIKISIHFTRMNDSVDRI